MAKKNKPDKLAQEVSQARAVGMSYGKWKALQPVVVIEPPENPDDWKNCEFCGKPFKRTPNKRYCESECAMQAFKERRKKAQAEK